MSDRPRANQPDAGRQGLGRRGEILAARHLEALGMRIVERNVRLPGGEIDLVAQEADELVFVEVKARIGDQDTAPDVAVTAAKLERLGRLAEAYVERAGSPTRDWRVDVVAVVLERSGRIVRIDHLPGAYL